VLNSQRTYLTTFDVSSGVFAPRIAFPATAGPFRKWDGALSVFSTPTPTPTIISMPTTCSELSSIYAARQNQTGSIDFVQYLIMPTDPEYKEACWRLFENIIFYVLRHEIGENQDHFNLRLEPRFAADEITALTGRSYIERGASIGTTEVADAFSNAFSTPSTYYLFTRVFLNGLQNAAQAGVDPLNYFASNLNSAISGQQNCLLTLTPRPIDNRIFSSACVELYYWDNLVQSSMENPEFREVYNQYITHIRAAITDVSYNVPDPTQGALGIRPMNRFWSPIIRNAQSVPPGNPNFGPVAPHDDPFVFRTYITRIVDFTWTRFDYIDVNLNTITDYYITSPSIFTPLGTTVPAFDVYQCRIYSESIDAAYMRNLREAVYSDSTYASLPTFAQSSYYTIDQVRFGLSASEGYGVYFHSLVAETDQTTAAGAPSAINVLSWQTFILNRRRNPASDPPGRTVRPLLGPEVIAINNGVRVEPVSCP
jgi:hypothetical protein